MTYAPTVAQSKAMPDVSKNFPFIIKPKEEQSVVKTKEELNMKSKSNEFWNNECWK